MKPQEWSFREEIEINRLNRCRLRVLHIERQRSGKNDIGLWKRRSGEIEKTEEKL